MINTVCELPQGNPPSEDLIKILRKYNRIAMVGLSPKEDRDSNKVARYLMEKGYEIFPVNPGQKKILDKPCYKSLKDIPQPVDIANLFLNPSRVPAVVDQAIEIGVNVIWMQLGVVQNESADKARKVGIEVVMDRCIMRDHEKYVKDNDFVAETGVS